MDNALPSQGASSENGTGTTEFVAGGLVLHFKPVPPLFLERVANDHTGRPVPPLVEVDYPKGRTGQIRNESDPAYLKELESWENNHRVRILMFTIGLGIVEDTPEEFIQDYSPYFPEYKKLEMKYLWITSLLGDETLLERLVDTIMGQTTPTEKDIKSIQDTFPSPTELPGREDIPVQETSSQPEYESPL